MIGLKRKIEESDTGSDTDSETRDPTKCWNQEETALMLDTIEMLVRNGKFQRKKVLWIKLSEELKSIGIVVSWVQCENKYKSLLRTMKHSKREQMFSKQMRKLMKHEPFSQTRGMRTDESYMDYPTDYVPYKWQTHTIVRMLDVAYDILTTKEYRVKKNLFRDVAVVLNQEKITATSEQCSTKWKAMDRSYRKNPKILEPKVLDRFIRIKDRIYEINGTSDDAVEHLDIDKDLDLDDPIYPFQLDASDEEVVANADNDDNEANAYSEGEGVEYNYENHDNEDTINGTIPNDFASVVHMEPVEDEIVACLKTMIHDANERHRERMEVEREKIQVLRDFLGSIKKE